MRKNALFAAAEGFYMNRLLLACVLSLTVLSISDAKATSINLTLDDSSLRGTPGDSLTFSGTVQNYGTERIFLNGDSISVPNAGFDLIDLFFGAPSWIDPGESVTNLSLFQILLHDPFDGDFGSYVGSYSLLGGIDEAAQDQLVAVPFTIVAVAPEPWSGIMAGLGIIAAVLVRKFGRRVVRSA
jgi:hypothetical protein